MRHILAFSIAVLFCTVLSAQEIKPEIIKIGDKAPTFSIETLDGKIFNTAELKGKVIYLNFFATWCGPCMKEMPHIESEIWKDIKQDDFVMLSIAREHTKEDIVKWQKEKGYTLPFAVDPKREVYSLFAPQYIPRNIVIARNGDIVYTEKNFDKDEFAKMVDLIKAKLQAK